MSDEFRTQFQLNGPPEMQDEERRQAVYQRVFGTIDGRLVLADILARGGVGAPAWQPGQALADGAYYAGAHAMALSIAADAGLNIGRLGSALVEGKLETMKEPHDD